LCPSLICLAEAWRRRAFSRALRCEPPGPNQTLLREQFVNELRRRGLSLA
jgi:hypothetical protein